MLYAAAPMRHGDRQSARSQPERPGDGCGTDAAQAGRSLATFKPMAARCVPRHWRCITVRRIARRCARTSRGWFKRVQPAHTPMTPRTIEPATTILIHNTACLGFGLARGSRAGNPRSLLGRCREALGIHATAKWPVALRHFARRDRLPPSMTCAGLASLLVAHDYLDPAKIHRAGWPRPVLVGTAYEVWSGLKVRTIASTWLPRNSLLIGIWDTTCMASSASGSRRGSNISPRTDWYHGFARPAGDRGPVAGRIVGR